jgi:phosphopentomutase
MVMCDKNKVSNKGLEKLKQLRELNMIACDQKSINDDIFKSIGKNLLKLNISCCYQFSNQIFNYLPSNCKIEMNKLNLTRNSKMKRKHNSIKN